MLIYKKKDLLLLPSSCKTLQDIFSFVFESTSPNMDDHMMISSIEGTLCHSHANCPTFKIKNLLTLYVGEGA
jgi:hypothetical protein